MSTTYCVDRHRKTKGVKWTPKEFDNLLKSKQLKCLSSFTKQSELVTLKCKICKHTRQHTKLCVQESRNVYHHI